MEAEVVKASCKAQVGYDPSYSACLGLLALGSVLTFLRAKNHGSQDAVMGAGLDHHFCDMQQICSAAALSYKVEG